MHRDELVARLRPLVKQQTLLTLTRVASDDLPVAGSHFGGVPYMESGETWPICPSCGLALGLVCQVDTREGVHEEPRGIGLITFYYCEECKPLGVGYNTPQVAGEWVVR